ncbi:PRC-barrel domain-containing protein [Acetobacter estunensis]|uniref:PRC-barrel domain-containing protein n=1 Tax=Acetobacter estunensis TaxID=104097 RepID=UPI001C2DC947|nr:PRC-barrel domain-containing protein [Acetobacter estunensis]MBV1836402.1 PRC-barrel domain-containing protein [Acetobacter estunensis]
MRSVSARFHGWFISSFLAGCIIAPCGCAFAQDAAPSSQGTGTSADPPGFSLFNPVPTDTPREVVSPFPAPDGTSGDNPDLRITLPVVPIAPTQKDASSIEGEIGHERLDGLIDREVLGADGHVLGHVVNVLIGSDGEMRAVVLDIGGFLGVGSRRVAVSSVLLTINRDSGKNRTITLYVPDQAIRSAPQYDPDAQDVSVLIGPRVAPASAYPMEDTTPSDIPQKSDRPSP